MSRNVAARGRLFQRLGPGLLIACCLLGVWQAAQIGAADIYRYQVRRDLNRWEQAGGVPSLDKWQRAWSYNRKSRQFDPVHPLYLNQASRIQEWRLFVADAPANPSQPVLQRALAAQRQAVQRQPAWPPAWAHLAVLKARLLELDAEFERALVNSLALGPWEPGVHIMLVDIALMRWELLADSTRVAVQQAFDRKTRVAMGIVPWVDAIREDVTFERLCRQSDLSMMVDYARQACWNVMGK